MEAASESNALSIRLEACAPERRCHRAYAIDVVQDLFGVWLVEMSYGRIGVAYGIICSRNSCAALSTPRRVAPLVVPLTVAHSSHSTLDTVRPIRAQAG